MPFKKSIKTFLASLLESRKLHPFSSHLKQALSHSSIISASLLKEICIHLTGTKPAEADENTLAGYPSLSATSGFVWVLILPEFGKN